MASLISIGTKAMTANYAALNTIGHNISNANVEGYSRQSVQLATATGQYTGAGFFGKGVDVSTVSRTYNAFLTGQAWATASTAAMDDSHATQLEMLEAVFGTGESGIGYAASSFLNALTDVGSAPSDSSARQVVLARAKEFASRLKSASDSIDSLQGGVTQELKNSVEEVNSLASRIAQINDQIARTQGSGHTANDLLDQRDQLIKDLSQFVQVSTTTADDGSLNVFIAGGQRLVLGAQPETLTVVQDMFDPQRSAIALTEGSSTRRLEESLLTGGSLAGLLQFQNQDLVDARTMVGQVAAAVSGAVNKQQALGLDLLGNAGADIFAIAGPRVMPAATNTGSATITLSITDPAALQASEYELRGTGAAGVYELTRLSDGQVFSVSDGDEVDGFTIDMGATAPDADDRFLFQPVTQAASQMRMVMTDPRGIAAASPVTAAMGSANTGTASVASVAAVSTSLDPTATVNISFTDNSGGYDWQMLDSGGSVVSSGSGTWTAGTAISLNGFELELNGIPKNGDTISVAPTADVASSNGNALAMLGLRDEGIVAGNTVTDAWSAHLADIGVRVQSTRSSADISATVATDAETARANYQGVNLDEEAARLIQFQQAYQAAAKILEVANSVFDTLLRTAG